MRVAYTPRMLGTFSRPPQVNDPDMHHGTCVTWCMPVPLTSGLLWSQWRGKRFRHPRRMRNSQFYVSGKRPMEKSGQEILSVECSAYRITYELCLNIFRRCFAFKGNIFKPCISCWETNCIVEVLLRNNLSNNAEVRFKSKSKCYCYIYLFHCNIVFLNTTNLWWWNYMQWTVSLS